MNEPTEHTEARKDNENSWIDERLNGVVTSITEKMAKLISSVEVDLKYTLSKQKESNNLFFAGLQSGFLTEDGDHKHSLRVKKLH